MAKGVNLAVMAGPTSQPSKLDLLLALAATARAAEANEEGQRQIVDALRLMGATWDEVGEAVGISRQAARSRYGR